MSSLPVAASAAGDPLFTPDEAARYLRISIATLERYRLSGTPAIRYIKYGPKTGKGPVRYRKSDLDAFLNSASRTSTSAVEPSEP